LARALDAALKRFASGTLRTVAFSAAPSFGPHGMGGKSFNLLREHLEENARVLDTDLASGRVPDDADILLVVGPRGFNEKQLYAMDQFLMQGGTVIVAASPVDVNLGRTAFTATKQPTGLEPWLGHHGVTLDDSLVLDPQNTPFPIPIQRVIGGYLVHEFRSLSYPYFPD